MPYRPVYEKPRLILDWGTEQHERETHWTSLFYDLLLVAALNALAEPFEEFDDSGENTFEGDGLETNIGKKLEPIKLLWLDAMLQFFAVVNPWNTLNEFTSMFEDESLIGHLYFFLHCFGIGATVASFAGELSENYRDLAIGMIIARVGLIILWVRPIRNIKRVRAQGLFRCADLLVTISILLYGLMRDQNRDYGFEEFRKILIISTIWEWMSVLSKFLLTGEQLLPIHIQSFSDRFKEITMVIFGEAIFVIVLRPFRSDESFPETHGDYYVALGSTLWLIYALALQEFHLHPSEKEHALRRSKLFGTLWYYTQQIKQVSLLGTAIGIKRTHLLTFAAPHQSVDSDTRNLLVWSISLTLLAVVLIRSYSFGFGRHPSKNDPLDIYCIKMAWWTILSISCGFPQLLSMTLLKLYDTPCNIIISLGGMMSWIIFAEAFASTRVEALIKKCQLANTNANQDTNETTHLLQCSENADETESSSSSSESDFLCVHAPKSTKE